MSCPVSCPLGSSGSVQSGLGQPCPVQLTCSSSIRQPIPTGSATTRP